jgi:hypothetical protein
MQQWVDGVLSNDPAASDKLKTAIEFSHAMVAEADAAAPLSGAGQNARNCHVKRAEILEAIEREIRDVERDRSPGCRRWLSPGGKP